MKRSKQNQDNFCGKSQLNFKCIHNSIVQTKLSLNAIPMVILLTVLSSIIVT